MILWATIGVHAGRFALISEKIFLSASIGMPAGRFCEMSKIGEINIKTQNLAKKIVRCRFF
jgi:hypothetical protein